MLKTSVQILAALLFTLAANTAFAQSHKIDLGEGKVFERAAAGERVRVLVDFSIPAAELPDGADSFAVRRDMIKNTRSSLLDDIFGPDLVVADTVARLNTADTKALAKTLKNKPVLSRSLDNVPNMAMELTRVEMEQLANDPRITRIYQDAISRTQLNESTVLVGAPTVWGNGAEGSGVSVAILDTGVSHQHTMIKNKVAASACFSTTSAAVDTTSFCPSGNNSEIGPNAGESCPVDDPATVGVDEGIDGCFHGTHVASIAMGGELVQTTGSPLYGVARGADVVAIQVFTRFNDPESCDPDGSPPDPASAPCIRSFSSDQRAALDYLVTNAATLNLAAVNMSLGGGDEVTNASLCDLENSQTKSLIDQLRILGVATIIASGNESFNTGVSAPGCISTAITVGSSTKADAVSSFSNSSELVDLLAPGSFIRAATPLTGAVSNSVLSSGTSMAAPHVAGAFALLRSANPGATVQQIEDALKSTGIPINDGRVNSIVKPRIRVDFASSQLSSGGVGLGDVALTPLAGFLATGDLGNPAGFSTKVYTLTNNGTGTANFSVSGDKNWLKFSNTSGAIAPNGGTASVTVSVETSVLSAGQTDTGTITFTVGSNSTSLAASLTVAMPLLNDDFAEAFALSGITVSTSGSSVGASFETGEVEHNPEFTDTGGSSVWFKWTAPLAENFTFSTEGSNFDTVMSIYTGTGVTALTFVAGNDDAISGSGGFARTAFDAIAGTTYFIVIDGFNGASGLYDLSITPTGAPAIDAFASAMAISGSMGSASTQSVNATAETGEPDHAGQTATKSVWFDWSAPADGNFTFNTDGSSFDTVLAIYTGTDISALTSVASNDNQGIASISKPSFTPGASQVTFNATSGQSYKIAIDGKSDTGGLAKLNWYSSTAPQPSLVTAVLPNARSITVGQPATAFMTVINTGPGNGTSCGITLPNTDFAGGFSYQTTDAVNQTTGSADTPVDIAASSSQNFVFAVTPSEELSAQVLTPLASCAEGTSSLVTTGVNTFLLSSAFIEPADMLSISLTLSGNGVIEMTSSSDTGFVTLATASIGANATLTLNVGDGGANLPLTATVCETDPVTAVCLATPTSQLTFNSVNGETRTFAAFVTATGDIPFAPGQNRLFLSFDDANGVSRGGTSVAVRTDYVPPASQSTGARAGLE